MTIRERSVGDVTILDIGGRITIQEGADLLRDAVRRLVSQGRVNLVLNVQAVPYVDSTALGEIIRAHTTVVRQGGAVKLLHVTPRVRELLTMTRLLAVFDAFEGEAEAVASFRTVPPAQGAPAG